MLKVLLCGTFFMFATLGANMLQAQPSLAMEIANLSEDVRGLKQRVNELQLRVEQLERENSDLQGKASSHYVTLAQLNEAVADLNRSIKSASSATKQETLQQVSVQMEKLANQMNAALESLANTRTSRSSSAPASASFSDDYPKEGVSYVVQKGDTLAIIARKTGARTQDIINANKLSDPSKIQAGQTLFVPGGKQ